jgi:hypothetical protein
MFKKKELQNGAAHRAGQQYGKDVRYNKGHKNRKGITKTTAYRAWVVRSHDKGAKPGMVMAMTEEEKAWFPDVWEALVAQVSPPHDPQFEAPWKRQPPAVEDQACRDLRIYKRCSRNCKPRAFGGCKGYRFWPSCPQLEPKEE